jgi:hypothetical protein
MCLDKLTKKYRRNNDIRVGYKVVELRSKPYDPVKLYIGQFRKYTYTEGVHESADDKLIQTIQFKKGIGKRLFYRSGFHVYKNLDDAMSIAENSRYVVVEVHAWHITAEGIDWDRKTFVAKHMRIIREIPKRKEVKWIG